MEERLVVDLFTEEEMHWWHIAKRRLIKKFIRGNNLHILVAGVGGGKICDELKSCGHHVVGLDISPASCEHIKNRFGVPAIRADLEKPLPFIKGSFDLIIIADVLEHIKNDKQLMAESGLCLKSNGKIIISVPAYPHMWSLWDVRLNHKRRYTLAGIKEKVAESGLKLQRASYFHALLYPLAYIYRIILHLPAKGHSKNSEFAAFYNKPISAFFAFHYALERVMLQIIDLPFGLSIFAVGVKNG